MNIQLVLILLLLCVSGLLSLFVAKDRKQLDITKISFIGFSASLSAWQLLTYLSDQESTIALIFNRALFVFPPLLLIFIAIFIESLHYNQLRVNSAKLYTILAAVSTSAALSPFIVLSIESRYNDDSGVFMGYNIERGWLYLLFIAIIFYLSFRVIYMMSRTFTRGQTDEVRQMKIILVGFLIAMMCSILFTVALPIITGNSGYAVYGVVSGVIFLSAVTYSIMKYKFLSFKSTLTRSVSYLLAAVTVALVYSAVILVIQNYVLKNIIVTRTQLAVNVATIVALVSVYPQFKLKFNKLTNKLFYRDAYDAQALIDELNKTLVTDVEVTSLLEKTAAIIEKNIKSSYCGFYIRETAYFSSRFIANYRKKIPEDDLEKIRQLTPQIRSKVHSTDAEALHSEEKILNEILKKNDIEVLGRLVTTLQYEVAGVGYMLLGAKRSGEVYSEQDLKVLEIITNELVLAVENALRLEEIEKFNVTLQNKIDSATKELKESNEKLLALDEAKDEFVSMASHQLRTPLTSIKGYISMVLEEDAGEINETQKKMLGQAFFSSQRMVYLISDLLNVSRLKTGKFLIEPRPVNLANIVDSELQQLREGAVSKDQTLSFTKPDDFPILNLDDMKIRQVIMNFTDNAMYYTPTGGKITIELKDKKSSIEFTVKDSGIGVPKNEQHKMFTKFYRAENARKARPDGTGLGLFMAKKVIVAQGGAIIFNSKENKGSTFGFSFPKAKLLVEPEETDK